MHIWIDLITREAAFLATLAAMGAGPASFLSERVDRTARVALAPALGMCVGVVVTFTLLQYEPIQSTYWVILALAVVSVGVAVWRIARAKSRVGVPFREAAQVCVLAVVVLGPASYTLQQHGTVGPVGLNVYDAANYVAETDSAQTRSLETASARLPPYQNLEQFAYTGLAVGYQQVDVAALEGTVNDFLGLHATDTQSAFMVALLLVGGLGAFAAFRYATGSRGWGGVLAGGLFGGPFFLYLWADSSQAAIAGLALELPFVLLAAEALIGRRLRDYILLGLVSSGLLSVYPLFVPQVVIGSATVLALLLVRWARRRRRGPVTARTVIAGVWPLVLVLALAAALSPIAFGRDLRYWQAILGGTLSFSGLPPFHVPIGVAPAWLLQTREWDYLPSLAHSGAKDLLITAVLPLTMIGLIVLGLKRYRRTAVLLAFIAACSVLAEYVSAHNGCGYCAQRNLLPIGPIAALLVATGISALVAWRSRVALVAGIIAALVVVGAVAQRTRTEHLRIIDTAYMLDPANRSVLSHLPKDAGSVLVEGFGENIRGAGEMPLVYQLVDERTDGHVSIALARNDNLAPAYLGGPRPPGPEFNPHYRYVLTRFAGVATDRRIIARDGGIALEERTQPLDVTPVGGLGVPLARFDPAGSAWIQSAVNGVPLLLYVTGGSKDAAVWARLEISTSEPVGVPRQSGVTFRRTGAELAVCIKAQGSAPLRTASLLLSFSPKLVPPAPELFQLPMPEEGVELRGMSATTGGCIP